MVQPAWLAPARTRTPASNKAGAMAAMVFVMRSPTDPEQGIVHHFDPARPAVFGTCLGSQPLADARQTAARWAHQHRTIVVDVTEGRAAVWN